MTPYFIGEQSSFEEPSNLNLSKLLNLDEKDQIKMSFEEESIVSELSMDDSDVSIFSNQTTTSLHCDNLKQIESQNSKIQKNEPMGNRFTPGPLSEISSSNINSILNLHQEVIKIYFNLLLGFILCCYLE